MPPAAAIGVGDDLFFHFGAENHRVSQKTSCSVLNTFQPKSMVQYRRGHGSVSLRSVRWLSNNTDGLCHVHFLFSKTIQVRICRKTHFYLVPSTGEDNPLLELTSQKASEHGVHPNQIRQWKQQLL
jgi:hypothetical protein